MNAWSYLIGLIVTGIAVGNMDQYSTVHGFLVIGCGLMLAGIIGSILSYLNGEKETS